MAYPTLNANAVFASLYNQVISIQLYSVGIVYEDDIVQSRKMDGTLLGDTKVYVDTDILRSYEWSHTDSAYNLLTHKRPPAPASDEIVIDTFRQIPVTIDDYLTKQAWSDEGSFSQFNSTILGWMGTTRSVYEHTKFTNDIIMDATSKATSVGTISLKAADFGTAAAATPLELNMWQKSRYLTFSRKLKGILRDLNEASRSYNDHGFMKNINPSEYDLIVPTGIKQGFEAYEVPLPISTKEVHWMFWGAPVAAGTSDGTKRARVEADFTNGTTPVHLFPGELIPNGYAFGTGQAYTPTYTAQPDLNGTSDLTFLLIHREDYPIPSAFSVSTSFFNPKDLVTNHYMTFGYSNPLNNHLGGKPLLKVVTDQA